MADLEIRGATVLESSGMGRILANNSDVPIFSSLQNILAEHSDRTTTIFAVSKHDDKIAGVMEVLESTFAGFKAEDGGIMFTVPVNRAVGLARKLGED